MDYLHKLVSIGSPPLLDTLPVAGEHTPLPWMEKILPLLRLKNGFYAFESALHVFPLGQQLGIMDIEQWNSGDTWRNEYQGTADGITFFAEDIFGFQFGATESGIVLFNPEDASTEHLTDDIQGWVQVMLEDYDSLTGYSFAHLWQTDHGPLQEGRRLIFKIPLILGGDADIDNIGEISAIEGMRSRGDLYSQIRDLPDGTVITLNIVD